MLEIGLSIHRYDPRNIHLADKNYATGAAASFISE